MKNLKKFASLLLVLTLAVALAVPAMAAADGTITINGVGVVDDGGTQTPLATYEIYQILDLSLGGSGGSLAYSYTLIGDKNTPGTWAYFFNQNTIKGVYVTIDGGDHVTWISENPSAESVAQFAQLALAYAEANGIDPIKTTDTPAGAAKQYELTAGTLKFSGLELGYYLVDSTMGALCGLTTTNPNASINAKNVAPTVDKQVKEDSTGNFTTANTADIGQIVEFQTTISVHAGAQNYVLHDEMSEGFTFRQDAVINPTDPADVAANASKMGVTSITHIKPSTSEAHVMDAGYYTLKITGDADDPTDDGYEDCADDCAFEIYFTPELCAKLETNDKIVVTYQAMLNRNAVIAGDGNANTAWLTFGEENHVSTGDQTITKTFKIDLVKTDTGNNPLSGAQFRIYDAATGGNEILVVLMYENDNVTPKVDENGNQMYRRARTDETGVAIVVENAKGQITIAGLDNGTYYLEEKVAPDGYNKLLTRKSFTIADGNMDAVYNDNVFSTGSGVHVVNSTGTMLPETGGMGTVLFVTFGMLVVLGAGVLLVTKKRMAMIED